jgi:hypothetical protein
VIESNLNLSINSEEHEMINIALTQLLDSAENVLGYVAEGENQQIDLLRNVREKSYELWAKRFDEPVLKLSTELTTAL